MKTSSIMAIQIIIRAAGAIPGNLFAQTSKHYVNPAYQAELDTSIATATGSARQTLEVMRSVPSAYWIDTKAKVRGNTTSSLEGILADAASKSPPPLVVAILYNLPNRDCDSSNSRGEICCTYKADGSCDYIKAGDCQAGLDEYKHQYVDPFAELLKRYAHVPTAVIVEPDSLPNLATNKQNPKCANSATAAAYTLGIPYAVHALATANPKAALYLDAAHGGWLGWPNNAQAYATLLATLRVSDKLRGLSSNVANYQGVGTPCPASAFDDKMHNWCAGAGSGHACCEDPCGLLAQWSAGNNEYKCVAADRTQILSNAAAHAHVPRPICGCAAMCRR